MFRSALFVIFCFLVQLVISREAVREDTFLTKDDKMAPPYYLISVKAERYMLPLLGYELNALEPYISHATVTAHYEGHHDAYRKKMNTVLNEWREDEPTNQVTTQPIVNILKDLPSVPEKFRSRMRNNMGGFVNHCIYWGVISPNPDGVERLPTGTLLDEINSKFGSFDSFKEQFTIEALNLFGSGYVWLVKMMPIGNCPSCTDFSTKLSIMTTANQDSPISQKLFPLLVIDVWEHAYYLEHQYRRAEYVANWWKLVDWELVAELDRFWKGLDGRFHDEL